MSPAVQPPNAPSSYRHVAECRFCGGRLALELVDLGAMPLPNLLPETAEAARTVPRYPLRVVVCEVCGLAQLDVTVAPELMFNTYLYFSSYSASWVEHARRFADDMAKRLDLGPRSHVVEVASNDGYLLRHFVERGIPVLGVEPAANVAAAAQAAGVATDCAFFSEAYGRGIMGTADLLIANNVLAHVPDIKDFVAGLKAALSPTGVLSLEVPHLLQLIKGLQFDTVYHEHYFYFSLLTLERILAVQGLQVFSVTELPTHGGSLRVLAGHAGTVREEESVRRIRDMEQKAGLNGEVAIAGFGQRVKACLQGVRSFLDEARATGRTVAGYGAAAKGTILLNACGATDEDIALIGDANTHKQGRYLPGCAIPISAPSAVLVARPDDLLILPWNLKAEIIKAMDPIRSWNGRFVIPVPAIAVC